MDTKEIVICFIIKKTGASEHSSHQSNASEKWSEGKLFTRIIYEDLICRIKISSDWLWMT